MNELELIEKAIKKIPRGRIFFSEDIYAKCPIQIAQRVLLRLVKNNDIGTLGRGVYFRPKKSHYLPGILIPPGADEIVKAVSKKTGEIISVHGAVALNQLGLCTQVPMRQIFYTSGCSRHIKVNGKNRINLVHVNPKIIVMPNTVTCHVVAALWYLGKECLKPRVIKKLHNRIGDNYFGEVLMNMGKMPAWMRGVFLRYQDMRPDDPELQEDPNECWQG